MNHLPLSRLLQVPIIIPYLVLVISFYLVVGPIIDYPRIEYLYALLFIAAGLIFYVPFVKLGMTPRFMSEFNGTRLPNQGRNIKSKISSLSRQSDVVLAAAARSGAHLHNGNVRLSRIRRRGRKISRYDNKYTIQNTHNMY